MKTKATVVFVSLAAAAAFAMAAGAAGPTGKASGSLSDKDRTFVQKAAIGGMAEVEQGKVAEQKAGDAQVRKFGSTMVADHSKANDKLKALAQTRGWELPTALDDEHKGALEALKGKSGADFDRAYAEDMQKDHDEDVALFQDAAKNADDADVRRFAQNTLPTLEHHKKMAHELKPAKR